MYQHPDVVSIGIIERSIRCNSTEEIDGNGQTDSEIMSECFALVGGDCDSTEDGVIFGTTEDGGQYQLRIVRD